MKTKEYLGDSVYAEYDSDTNYVKLTTENGLTTTNEIYLEPGVIEALDQFIQTLANS